MILRMHTEYLFYPSDGQLGSNSLGQLMGASNTEALPGFITGDRALWYHLV